MSDATLPPPRCSSAGPAAGDGNRSDSSSGEVESDASLIQSSDAASKEERSGNPEGRIENKQKRKRTSPRDQAILEAEYRENPKPNKAARAVIVEKVGLNEKEVQIWFQNRRQINRRKSRPLLPHEIAAFGLGGTTALSFEAAAGITPSSSQSMGDLAEQKSSQENDIASSQESQTQEPIRVKGQAADEKAAPTNLVESSQSSLPSSIPTLKSQSSSDLKSTQTSSFSVTENVLKSFSFTPGYLSNRWNAVNSAFSTPSSSQIALFGTPALYVLKFDSNKFSNVCINSNPALPSSCPERIGDSDDTTPSSRVRLTMSLDGKAQLVSGELSPLCPTSARPTSSEASIPQQRTRGLQRSQSANVFSSLPHKSPSGPFVPRLTSGRSRDARTWEFCCDPEARDELTTQAENESNGSAVAAISLLRSTSNSALKSNSNKRNAPSTKQDLGAHGKKPKLGRAMSSVARLQSTGKPSIRHPQPNEDKEGRLMRSPSGDSDKENWVPGEKGSRRRPLPSVRLDTKIPSKAVLGDNFNVPTHAHNLGRSKTKRRKAAYVEPKVFEDNDQENSVEVGEEVEKFMRGEVSPSKKGDLDCIQGLLSLSKGNWR